MCAFGLCFVLGQVCASLDGVWEGDLIGIEEIVVGNEGLGFRIVGVWFGGRGMMGGATLVPRPATYSLRHFLQNLSYAALLGPDSGA